MNADPHAEPERPGDSRPSDALPDDGIDEDDEALRWDGERDASLASGANPATLSKRAQKKAARTPAADEPATDHDDIADADDSTEPGAQPAPTSSFLLVSYGILAGAFALYVVGWFTAVRRSTYVDPDPLANAMFQLGEVLAVVAPLVWFGTVFLLTRTSKPIVRLLWLLLGLVVLVPVPFVLGV
jgi:hypothetical protein